MGGSHKLALVRGSQTKLDQPARSKASCGRKFLTEGVVGGEKREKLRGKTDEGGGAGVLERRACAGSTLCQEIGLVTLMFFFELLSSLCFLAISLYVYLY